MPKYLVTVVFSDSVEADDEVEALVLVADRIELGISLMDTTIEEVDE